MNKPTFAIIGSGFIFPQHFYAIKQNGGIILDIANREETWREMIKTTKAEYIVILTPNDLHYAMIKFAVENGKKVICEKPLVIGGLNEIEEVCKMDNVYPILQLRYHPLVQEIKKDIEWEGIFCEIEMNIFVHRDEEYYNSWKGDNLRSGGIVWNLGIHYFDLLFYLFDYKLNFENHTEKLFEKEAIGNIFSTKFSCNWHLSTETKKEEQKREFIVNGKSYNFSSKDNLSFESLHGKAYEAILNGKGIKTQELYNLLTMLK